MRRAWIWGLLLLVTSCAEKAPPEGAVRVAVRYGSYPPACVRVVARDDLGHEGSTDILQEQFNNAREQLVRVAVFRKADWGRELMVEASSFTRSAEAKCSGTRVETFSKRVEVPLGDYANFEALLEATDEDQDGSPALTRSAEGLDCDDSRPDVFPGAEERCGVGVDYDCDGLAGCQDTKCQQKACDDGNACTTGTVCVGSGTLAQCVGKAVVCPQPEGRCVTGARCVQETGACVTVRKECTAPGSVCLENAGVCNESNGNCEYKPKPAATNCDDSQVCTTGEQCNGQGSCVGTRSTCTTSNPCLRAAGTCPAAGDCREELDPAKVDTACPIANETLGGRCRVATGKCSRFPYEPSHFDPDTIPSARIVDLTLTCNVTFDSTTLSWTPANCVTSAPTPFELTQGGEAVLLPILNLSMNGTLRLVGNRPVIFAVFGNATLTQDILANGTGTTPGAGGNGGMQVCETRRGRGGVVGASVGGGGGGAGGGLAGPLGGKGSTPGALPGDGGGTETLLAGGCPGGSGGGDNNEGGKAGAGGGMVQVSVAGTLTVNKAISVSGGGGGGGGTSPGGETGGGGGGGGGGRILLEAQQVVMAGNAARLTANGGGGGKGGAYRSANDRGSGNGGIDGYVLSESPAPGATSGNNSGGNGGAGGGRDRTAEAGKESTPVSNDVRGGGGGGGGAVGVIRLRSQRPCSLSSAVFSPNIDRQCPL